MSNVGVMLRLASALAMVLMMTGCGAAFEGSAGNKLSGSNLVGTPAVEGDDDGYGKGSGKGPDCDCEGGETHSKKKSGKDYCPDEESDDEKSDDCPCDHGKAKEQCPECDRDDEYDCPDCDDADEEACPHCEESADCPDCDEKPACEGGCSEKKPPAPKPKHEPGCDCEEDAPK